MPDRIPTPTPVEMKALKEACIRAAAAEMDALTAMVTLEIVVNRLEAKYKHELNKVISVPPLAGALTKEKLQSLHKEFQQAQKELDEKRGNYDKAFKDVTSEGSQLSPTTFDKATRLNHSGLLIESREIEIRARNASKSPITTVSHLQAFSQTPSTAGKSEQQEVLEEVKSALAKAYTAQQAKVASASVAAAPAAATPSASPSTTTATTATTAAAPKTVTVKPTTAPAVTSSPFFSKIEKAYETFISSDVARKGRYDAAFTANTIERPKEKGGGVEMQFLTDADAKAFLLEFAKNQDFTAEEDGHPKFKAEGGNLYDYDSSKKIWYREELTTDGSKKYVNEKGTDITSSMAPKSAAIPPTAPPIAATAAVAPVPPAAPTAAPPSSPSHTSPAASPVSGSGPASPGSSQNAVDKLKEELYEGVKSRVMNNVQRVLYESLDETKAYTRMAERISNINDFILTNTEQIERCTSKLTAAGVEPHVINDVKLRGTREGIESAEKKIKDPAQIDSFSQHMNNYSSSSKEEPFQHADFIASAFEEANGYIVKCKRTLPSVGAAVPLVAATSAGAQPLVPNMQDQPPSTPPSSPALTSAAASVTPQYRQGMQRAVSQEGAVSPIETPPERQDTPSPKK